MSATPETAAIRADAPVYTRASVNYLAQMSVRPEFFAVDTSRDNLVLEAHEIDILDARALAQRPALERTGFELVQHPSAVTDFRDHGQIADVYQPEIEALIRGLTGAPRVVVGNAVLRWSEKAGDTSAFVNSNPARFVHVDYSRRSFEEFAAMHLAEDPDRDRWLSGRYQAINIWRVLNPPPHDVPLAVCHAGTTGPDDVTIGDAVIDAPGKPEFRFESSLYHANPVHRWYTFPDMRLDEALVFKAFDSNLDALQGCPHSAFDNPHCPPDATPRASAEIRAYAFFGER